MRSRGPAVIVFAAMLCVAACSSGNSNSTGAGTSPAATVVSGKVVDAYVAGASVSAYQVTTAGAQGALIAGPATTDANGNYSLTLGSYTGPVLLESTGGTYVDTSSGKTVSLANTGLTLMALLPSASGSVTAQVTPLTTLAAQLALTMISGGTSVASAASSANTAIGNYFGLSSLLTTALVDLTQPGCTTGASQPSLDESLLLAGIAQLAASAGVKPSDLLLALIKDVSADGIFDGAANGTPINVPLIAGGTVPLATLEAGAARQVAAGALPGLAAAITAFQGAAANACGASASSSQQGDLLTPQSAQISGVSIQVPVVREGQGATTAAAQVSFQFTTVPGTFEGSTVAHLSVTQGGTYYLHLSPAFAASSLTGNWETLSVTSPAGQSCGVSGSAGTSAESSVSGTFNTTTLVFNSVVYVICNPISYSVGGSISGYTGSGLVLTDSISGQESLVASGATSFSFGGYAYGAGYDISVQTQPTDPAHPSESCGVSNGTGTVPPAINPAVICTAGGGGGGTALNNPNGLALDSNNNLYVANSGGNEVLVYSEQVDQTTGFVTGLTQINGITAGISSPSRLAFDRAGNLYVTNDGTNSVTVYDTSLHQITADTLTHDIAHPLGVAIDNNGIVYVANNSSSSNSIAVYAPASGGGFTEAAFSPLTRDASGNSFLAPGVLLFYSVGGYDALFVGLGPTVGADQLLLYETPLNASSPAVYSLTNSGCASGPSGPTGVAVHYTGDPSTTLVYVASYYSSKVAAYGFMSGFLSGSPCPTPVMTSGSGSGVAHPEGLAVDGFGNVFVSNSSANTITVYNAGQIDATPSYTQH